MTPQQYQQFQDMQKQIELLTQQVTNLSQNTEFVGAVTRQQIPVVKVLNTSGTSSTNAGLRDITVNYGTGSTTFQVMDYPETVLVLKLNTENYAIPVYKFSGLKYD